VYAAEAFMVLVTDPNGPRAALHARGASRARAGGRLVRRVDVLPVYGGRNAGAAVDG